MTQSVPTGAGGGRSASSSDRIATLTHRGGQLGLRTNRPQLTKAATIIASVVAGLAVWEVLGRFVITNPLFFVPFSTAIVKLWHLVVTGELWPNLYVSSLEFGIGLGLSIVIGLTVGAVMAANKVVDTILEPWVSAFYATPLVALTPFFVLAFGIGVASKVALVFSLAVFPILINARAGLLATDASHLEMARSFDAPRRRLYPEVLFPSALPYILTGIRLAVGRALVAVVIGEIFFAQAGVGFLIALASQTFDLGTLFAGVIVFAVAGVLLTEGLKLLERRLAPWRSEHEP